MSQRVVGFVAICFLATAAAHAATCVGSGSALLSIPGAAGSLVNPTNTTMKDDSSANIVAIAVANQANGATDPYPSSIAVFFVDKDHCTTAQFPSNGGLFLGTSLKNADGSLVHMVPGRYCQVTNQSDKNDPLKPRNIIEVASSSNKCSGYTGFADIATLAIVYDKNNVPQVNKLTATFTVQCTFPIGDNTPVTGTLDFTASPTAQGTSKPAGVKTSAGAAPACQPGESGSGSSGGGGGTGGGGTPTPTNFSFVLPDNLTQGPFVVSPDQPSSFDFTTAVGNGFNGDVSLSVFSDARDSDFLDVSVSPTFLPAPGTGKGTVTVTTHPLTFPRDYNVTLVATTADGTQFAGTFVVSVLCDPPKILGTQQPQSQMLLGTNTALLKIKAAGSPPFSYQWYTGMRGMDSFPVKGANGPTMTTNQDGMYWVRVSNACGSADSEPATVSH